MIWRPNCNQLKLLLCFVPAFFVSFFSFAQNPIVTENTLAGTPYAEWGVPDFKDNRIAGFATKMSLNRGETVRFKINVQGGATFTMKIYRIGYYNGNGARLKHDLGTLQGTSQPNGISDPITGLLDCGNWSESASWNIPADAVSGLYIAKLVRTGGGSNHIAFIVRNDASNSALYLQFPDATWQAYNAYGGNCLYDGTTSYPGGHAVKVSYNRPFFIYNSGFGTDGKDSDWYMGVDYPMIRFLERNGYDVTYTCSNDVANNGSRLLNHKVFISTGHDEYWSKEQRNNVEAARNAGVHLAFFSGNEVYWKTRWESLSDGEHRTLVCYKEGLLGDGTPGERTCGNKCDGSTSEWTGLWRTGDNYDAGKPENALTGQISWVEYPAEIGVPAFYKKLRFWRNTAVANLLPGQTAFLGDKTLGYEWAYEQYESTYPSGRITMSSRTINSLTHKLSLYKHSSGALVFGAGTIQWSWGLDGNHWGGSSTVSPEMQQATVNLFADMGVQPGTLQSGLVPVTASSDATAPTSAITAPANGASFPSGATITVTGTATDAGGGVVAGVEVSFDGGNIWKQATLNTIDGTVSWSYTRPSGSNGTFNVRFRAFDDSGNMETASPGINVSVGGPDSTPPTVSSVSPANGSTGVSVGTTVTADFSEAVNTSTVTAATFQLRAGSTIVNASLSTATSKVTLTPSAVLSASTTYTVTIKSGSSGVKDMAGNPLATDYSWSFTTGAGGGTTTIFQPSALPAEPLANDGQGISVGVRFKSSLNGFITGLRYYKGAGTTGSHTGYLWTNNGTQLAQLTFTNETASGWQQASFSSPVAITAGVTYVASYFSPSGHYAVTDPYFNQAVVNGPLRGLADGEDGANGIYRYGSSSAFPNATYNASNYWVDVVFTTSGGPDQTAPTVSSVTPQSGATGVGTGTTVVANFSEAVNASTVTTSTFQLRGPGSTLVTATVSTASNQITLTPSAALAGSTTYTATITGGGSGVKDLAGNALASNFVWSFTTAAVDATAPTVSSVTPQSGATGVGTGTTVVANFSEAVNASTVTTSTFQLRGPGSTLVTATVSTSSSQITLTPSAALAGSTTYTATITGGASGVKDLAGNALASNFVWSFTTAAVDATAPTVSSVTPQSGATGVGTGTTVVANFSEAVNASTVTTSTFQLRGPGSTLVTATVSTASNQITLTPSAALAGSTTYTATITGGASGVKDLAGNALASNFVWSFTTVAVDATAPTVSSVTPQSGATGVGTGTTVVANFSEAVNASTVTTSTFQLRGPGSTLVTATVSTLSNQITLTPAAALAGSTTYTATITGGASGVKDLAGNALANNFTWSFTTAASSSSGCPCSVFQPSNTPADVANDGTGITLGMKFRSTQNGSITGIRYYKAAGSSGTRIGSLWSSSGTLLAQVNFTNETASGWQQASFSSPVAITAGITYVASYFSPSGDYVATDPYFSQAVVNGPLRALANGEDGSNGIYRYGSSSAFPNATYNASNYWVDVVFTTGGGSPDQTPPTVSSVTPQSGATGVGTGTTVVANFSEAVNASTITTSTFQLRGPGSTLVTATVSTASNQITLTPSVTLAGSTTYTATITGGASGVKDLAGNALASNFVWSFTTAAVDATAPTVSSVTPQSGATGVGTGTTVVANFSEAVNASTVTTSTFQLRGPGSTLVTAAVSTASNQITLTPSAALTGSTTYTATITGGASGVKDLAGNALASNFVWSFTTAAVDATAPTVSSVTPQSGATGIGTGTTVVANFSEAVNASTVTTSTFQLRGPGSTLVTATVSTASNQITLTPAAALAGSTTYTATITGGASGVKDLAGNALASNFVWSFTTAAVDATAPTVSSVTPLNGATGISTSATVAANFSEALNAATVTTSTFQLRDAVNTLVPSTVSTASNQITLIPSSALAENTTYTAAITGGASGVKDLAGNALANNFNWSFTTTGGSSGGTSMYILPPADVPNSPRSNDGTGIALGVRFRSSQNGTITGVRYYKGAGTTGTHTGQLWTNTGTLLAQAVFSNETASGWQTALFSTPVAITAGVNYVASYHSPSGDFAATVNYYTQAVVNGPLRGLADGESGPNGLYRYSSTAVFPNNGYQSSNYWADVVFVPADAGSAPAVTTHPNSQAACDGSEVIFNSAGNGSPAPGVQWQESANGTTWTNMSGETNSTLTLIATSALHNRQYRAVWTNTAGPVASNAATLTVTTIPVSPLVTVANNCGNSVLTASGFTGSLLWSTGATTPSITVTSAGNYSVIQTVNGCSSAARSGTAEPNPSTIATPVVTVTDHCGSSVLTASGFTGTLLWSNGATTPVIAVTDAGVYSVTQTENGCTSAAGSATASPRPTLALSSDSTATISSGALFNYIPTSTTAGTTFTWSRPEVTGINNAAANGTDNISETLVNTGSTPVNVTYSYTLTADGCTSSKSVVVTVNPASDITCSANGSITTSFTNTAIPAGRYIWFNSVLGPGSFSGISGTVNFYITNSKITFTANSQQYVLNVPDAQVSFDASVSSASTQFVNSAWRTSVPRSYASFVFMTGLAYQVPSNLPGGISNIQWTADIGSNKTGIAISWKWAAAVYTNFAGHSGLNIKPIGGLSQNPYVNTDKAGAPQNFKTSLVSGGKGTGGTNYTGNYSGTGNISCSPVTNQRSVVTTLQPSLMTRKLLTLPTETFITDDLDVKVIPNPTTDLFNIIITGTPQKSISVRVFDIFGQLLERHDNIFPGQLTRMGRKWRNGTYVVEVTQGSQKKLVKIVKAD